MKFSRIISLIAGENVFSRDDNSPRGFDKTFGQCVLKVF